MEKEIEKRISLIRNIIKHKNISYQNIEILKKELNCENYSNFHFLNCIENADLYDFAEWTIEKPNIEYYKIDSYAIDREADELAFELFVFLLKYKDLMVNVPYILTPKQLYEHLIENDTKFRILEILDVLAEKEECKDEAENLIHLVKSFPENKYLLFSYLNKNRNIRKLVINLYNDTIYIYHENDKKPLISFEAFLEANSILYDCLEKDFVEFHELNNNCKDSAEQSYLSDFLLSVLDDYESSRRNTNNLFFKSILDVMFGNENEIRNISLEELNLCEKNKILGTYLAQDEKKYIALRIDPFNIQIRKEFSARKEAIYFLNGAFSPEERLEDIYIGLKIEE